MKSVIEKSDQVENYRMHMICKFIQGICELYFKYCETQNKLGVKPDNLRFCNILRDYGILYDSNMNFSILKSSMEEFDNGAYTYSDKEVVVYDEVQDSRIYIDFNILMKRYALYDILNKIMEV